MKLKDIRRSIAENVEKLRPHLANYIAGLIAKPFKEFISENGLALKQYFTAKSQNGYTRSDQFQNELSNYYGQQDFTITPYSFGGLVAINMHGETEYRVLDVSADMPVFESLTAEFNDIADKIRSLMLRYERYVEDKHLPTQAVESLIRIIDYKKGSDLDTLVNLVLDADPILVRGLAQGLAPERQSSPFAKIIARWAYDPDQLSSIRLPQEKEILWEQFKRFNIAQSKGLRLDLNNVAHYDDFVDALRPFMRDMEDVDRYELAGLRMLTRFGDYKIYILDQWKPDESNPNKHDLIGDSGWCVANKSNWDSYVPPFYMVVKGSKKLVLLHLRTGEFKDVYNRVYGGQDKELILINFLNSDKSILADFVLKMVSVSSPTDLRVSGFKHDFKIFDNSEELKSQINAMMIDPRYGFDLASLALQDASLLQLIDYIENNDLTKDISKMKPAMSILIKNAILKHRQKLGPVSYQSLPDEFGLLLTVPDEQFRRALRQQPMRNYTSKPPNEWRDYYHLASAGGQSLSLDAKYDGFLGSDLALSFYGRAQLMIKEIDLYKRVMIDYGYNEDKDNPSIVKMREDIEHLLSSKDLVAFLLFVAIYGAVDKEKVKEALRELRSGQKIGAGMRKDNMRTLVAAVEVSTGISNEMSVLDRLSEAVMSDESDQTIAELELKLLDESLPASIVYARDYKGPWKMLELALRKSGDQDLIKKYKEEVLYGEEYE
jgi:hypothetical protein